MHNKKREVLSLGQAAKLADCSRDTIRRAAQRQELPAQMGPGRRGPQWWVREADLLDWLQDRGTLSQPVPTEQSSASEAQHEGVGSSRQTEQSRPEITDAEYAVLSTASEAEQAEHDTSSARQAPQATHAEQVEDEECELDFDSKVVSAEVHQAVIGELVEELRRADRHLIALQLQFSQNQNLLAEKSESLLKQEAEERAQAMLNKRLEAEKEKQARQAQQVQQELQQAQQELEKAQAEARANAEQLKEARRELESWEARRKQPFWKKLFSKSG